MSYKSSIDTYQSDLDKLLRMLDSYVTNYRSLVISLNDMNSNAFISRSKKRKAISQIEELGCIIDMVLDTICSAQQCYLRYVKIKCDVLCDIINYDFIRLEIEQELLSDMKTDFKDRFLTLCPSKGNNKCSDEGLND